MFAARRGRLTPEEFMNTDRYSHSLHLCPSSGDLIKRPRGIRLLFPRKRAIHHPGRDYHFSVKPALHGGEQLREGFPQTLIVDWIVFLTVAHSFGQFSFTVENLQKMMVGLG